MFTKTLQHTEMNSETIDLTLRVEEEPSSAASSKKLPKLPTTTFINKHYQHHQQQLQQQPHQQPQQQPQQPQQQQQQQQGQTPTTSNTDR
ncbi:putative GATA zinc finger domain-containing protein 25 [Homalodisca vitripennis]|uniref:putative GATA zinc finger domain-containing protein 25 n=1 Tax=Homalodisca vitripennis TaxID=197043 RepID=UPI001EE9F134|nr:putative GATA zinc finger domain-containing protein 25 [Homalodisca vitripennis]